MSTGADSAEHSTSGGHTQSRLALISAGAALLGGLLGASAGLGAAVIQSHAQRDLAIRDERRQAYVEMGVALMRYQATAITAPKVDPGDRAALAKAAEEVCALGEDLRSPAITVQILGAEDVRSAIESIITAVDTDCEKDRASAANGQALPESALPMPGIKFLAAARKDMNHGS